MSRWILLLVALLAIGAASARAETPAEASAPAGAPTPAQVAPPSAEELDVLLGTIRSNRRALVEVNLGLDPEERSRFQPVYESYEKEIGAVQQRLFGVVEDYVGSYSSLDDEKALSLIKAYLDADEDRTEIRDEYLERFKAVLPGRKVARLYQIENKMDAVLRYELASRIPVIAP
ncbi:MAG: hypothetical protein IT386_10050 [Deltaproteobacteria bacterium]|nr:hypothetical protein [Deltaproteobacteria bacterium]